MTKPEHLKERREYATYVRNRKLTGKPDGEILPLKEWKDAGKPRR